MKLAEYLFSRLKALNVESVHGVPGDYNLTLLDYVEPAGLTWVGNANELNAGYAADGYARMKGLGAIVTTFGVGELSAINAIAGAFTERAAVVHIVGTPPRNSKEKRLMIHHTLGDGDYNHFAQMATHVTVAQANLIDARTAAQQIDECLRQCQAHSRPVYIQVPVDMVDVEVYPGNTTIAELPATDLEINTTNPIILVDGEIRSLGIIEEVQEFINHTGWPTWTTSFSKGLVQGSNVYGIYQGSFDPETKKKFDNADLVLHFGPHPSTTNTYNLTALPDPSKTISFSHEGITTPKEKFRDVSVKKTVQKLLKIDPVKVDLPPKSQPSISASGEIKQEAIWKVMQSFLREGDIIMAETGTAAYGGRAMEFPNNTRFFTAVTWLSIGYMLPACQGAALAQKELIATGKWNKKARTILIIGDGSFQMTAQELSTIIRHNLNVVVFLINNDGYTIERCIHGVDQQYNDISFWRYLEAPSFFGAPRDSYTGSAKTYEELEKLLKDPKLSDGEGVRMVEIFMDKNDAPEGPLLDMMTKELKRVQMNGSAS